MRPSLLTLVLLATSLLAAQQPSQPSAAVRFSFDWPQGIPWQKFSITVESSGAAHFEGTPHPDGTDGSSEPVVQDFTMSTANSQKVFELAHKLNYFRGDLDSHIKHVAQTGKKTLAYHSPQTEGSATYNWSQNPDVQQITNLFTGIAMTIDYGEKLKFQYRFDKLGMDERLKELVDLQADHGVYELDIISPTLRKIADDPNVMNIARERAQLILRRAAQPPSAAHDSESQ